MRLARTIALLAALALTAPAGPTSATPAGQITGCLPASYLGLSRVTAYYGNAATRLATYEDLTIRKKLRGPA